MKHLIPFLLLSVFTLTLFAQEIKLPVPQQKGGMPLMDAFSKRESTREFSTKDIDQQTLSNLLWAGWGFNRSGKRTAPSARNFQEIDIYVAMKSGLYLYNAKAQALELILPQDIRSRVGIQGFAKEAPLSLIFVADFDRMDGTEDIKTFYSAVDTGYISQNVYLFCAAEGLATVVLGWVDKEALSKVMNLKDQQRILLTQPVGYPK